MDRGKRERGVRGIDPRPHLQLGWRVGAGRREQAAAGWSSCGGGAAGPGKEMGAAVGIGCEARGPFIADVGRLGRVWSVAAAWSPGELRGLH